MEFIEEQEKYNKDKRRKDGIEKSRTKGTIGRPKIEYKPEWDDTFRQFMNKKITTAEAKELTGLTKTMFYKFRKEFLENQK